MPGAYLNPRLRRVPNRRGVGTVLDRHLNLLSNGSPNDWKQKRELHRLDKRAERRENYAADAIFIAAAAIDEANVAFLEALEARLDAEEAHGAAGA